MSTRYSQESDKNISGSETAHIPVVEGKPQAQVKVHSNNHVVSRCGDAGLWDPTSNVKVNVDQVDGLPGGKN